MSGKWVTPGKWAATMSGLVALLVVVLVAMGLTVVGFFIFLSIALSSIGSNK